MDLIGNGDSSIQIPEVELDAVNIRSQVYGIKSAEMNSRGLRYGRNRHTASDSRQKFKPVRKRTGEDEWKVFVILDGAGWFNRVGFLSKDRPIRITIDGVIRKTFSTRNNKVHLIWGNHNGTLSSSNPDGLYFYNEDFNEDSIHYKINFLLGAVRFNTQLKIEYLYSAANSGRRSDYEMYVDYLMESEF